MYLEERYQGYLKMHQGWCESQNVRNAKWFWDKLESWKYDARFAKGQGLPIPDAPKIPSILSVNEPKCRDRFMEWESGLPQTFDFYIETKLPVPSDVFDLGSKPPAQPDDPVAGPDGDIPGQFLVSSGDRHEPGEEVDHPKYGHLIKTRKMTPFGPVLRWRLLR